jgi:hypothetical protein
MKRMFLIIFLALLFAGCSSENFSYRPISAEEVAAIQPVDYSVAPLNDNYDIRAIIPVRFSEKEKHSVVFFESFMIDSALSNISKPPQVFVTKFNSKTGKYEIAYYQEVEGDELEHDFQITDIDDNSIQEIAFVTRLPSASSPMYKLYVLTEDAGKLVNLAENIDIGIGYFTIPFSYDAGSQTFESVDRMGGSKFDCNIWKKDVIGWDGKTISVLETKISKGKYSLNPEFADGSCAQVSQSLLYKEFE